jgi:hypothetical protein
MFENYQGTFPPEVLAWCETTAKKLSAGLSPTWRRKGTWMETWNGSQRIAFAPHDFGMSIYFQSPSAAELYLEIGGRLSTGKMTIRLRMNDEIDFDKIRFVLMQYYHAS